MVFSGYHAPLNSCRWSQGREPRGLPRGGSVEAVVWWVAWAALPRLPWKRLYELAYTMP